MLVAFTSNTFSEDYEPTVCDNYQANVRHGDTLVTLSLWDTAGQEDFARIRPSSYRNVDVYVLRQFCATTNKEMSCHGDRSSACPYVFSVPSLSRFVLAFSLISHDSLSNVKERWIQELTHHCPDVPIVLVGTKLDLR